MHIMQGDTARQRILPVQQQDGEVDGLEVGNRGIEAAQQAPGEGHQPVACTAAVYRGSEHSREIERERQGSSSSPV